MVISFLWGLAAIIVGAFWIRMKINRDQSPYYTMPASQAALWDTSCVFAVLSGVAWFINIPFVFSGYRSLKRGLACKNQQRLVVPK